MLIYQLHQGTFRALMAVQCLATPAETGGDLKNPCVGVTLAIAIPPVIATWKRGTDVLPHGPKPSGLWSKTRTPEHLNQCSRPTTSAQAIYHTQGKLTGPWDLREHTRVDGARRSWRTCNTRGVI